MVGELEDLLTTKNGEWTPFTKLYQFIKSSIHYSDGLHGRFGEEVSFNIERLVDVLDQLYEKERHVLYPFVGAWNPRLVELTDSDFTRVADFRKAIVRRMRSQWIELEKREAAEYYDGLLRFQSEFQYPLRVFSLNYDLCVETTCGTNVVERGFSDRRWDWRAFNETLDDTTRLMLYKLHGSTDWFFEDDGYVSYTDAPSTIGDEEAALIFGGSYKLQHLDPFLFCVYELRRWTLDSARVVVCIGYSFSDDHINGILQQSLRQDEGRRLVAVFGGNVADGQTHYTKLVCDRLKAPKDRIGVYVCGARKFLKDVLSIEKLAEHCPEETDLVEELLDEGEGRR